MKDGQNLPLGPANLAWSFNRDGEARPEAIVNMENKLKVKVSEKRKQRQDLVPTAKPQEGVDALKSQFKRPTTAIPGVQPVSLEKQK